MSFLDDYFNRLRGAPVLGGALDLARQEFGPLLGGPASVPIPLPRSPLEAPFFAAGGPLGVALYRKSRLMPEELTGALLAAAGHAPYTDPDLAAAAQALRAASETPGPPDVRFRAVNRAAAERAPIPTMVLNAILDPQSYVNPGGGAARPAAQLAERAAPEAATVVRGLLGPGAAAVTQAAPEIAPEFVQGAASRLAADVLPPPPTIAAPPRAPFTAETARDMLLDQLGGAPMPAKARLLGALNEANFGGGAGNAMRAVTGGADLGALGDLERPYTNYLLQRTIENPNAITALRDLHPGLHAAVDLLPDLPERTALDLQNEVRRAAGLPEKVVKPTGRARAAKAELPAPEAIAPQEAVQGATGASAGAAPEPWQLRRDEFYATNRNGAAGVFAEGKRLAALPDDTEMWVYHASTPDEVARFAREGINPEAKPTNLARQRFEAGEEAEYAPGRGLGAGLYVGGTPQGASGYGREIVAIRVRKGDLGVSPEQAALGVTDGAHALAADDAVITRSIPPEDIRPVGEAGRYPAQGHEELIKAALREGRPVPPEVLADYPNLAPQEAVQAQGGASAGVAPELGATPAATRDLPAGTLPAPPATNYRTALSDYTDRLYHETDPEGASTLLEGQVSRPEMFYSNTPDLALGQGGRGVLLELAPEGIEGQINKKPGWQVSWESAGGAEFRDRLPSGPTIRDNIRSVTIQPGLKARDPSLTRMRRLLAREGWQPAALDDGATRYTRPTAPATGGGDVAAGGMGGQAPIQLATTLAGAAGGGVAGYQAAGDQASPTDRAAATLAGAAAGGTAGRFAPELVPVAQHIAQTVAKSAENTLLDPDVLKLGLSEGWKAFRAQQGAPGVRLVDLPAALGKAWRAQVVTTAHNLAQDALDRLAIVREFGRDYGVTMADVKAKVGDLRANWGREGNARYGQSATDLLGSLGKEDYDLQGRLGTSQIRETLQQTPGQQMSAPQRVLAGAGFGLGNLKFNAVPGLAPVVGAARGYAAPFIDRTFAVLNGLQHDAPRLAMFEGIVDRDLPVVADSFLGELRRFGIDPAPLEQARGRFSPQDVEQLAASNPVAQQAAASWDALSTHLLDAAGDRTARLFGDFRKTNPALRALSAVSPFSSWGVKRLPVVAELALRHPGAALLAARGLAASGEETKRQGLAPYYAGTIPVSTETPVLGVLARARLGGAAGTVHLNPLGVISPFGADALAPQPEELATTSAYQKLTQGMARVGLGVNPAIQAGAYATGQDTRPGVSLSRTAGLEYALPGPVIPSGKVALDLVRGAIAPTVQQALTGLNLGGAQTSTGPAPDPLRRAMADLYHEDTGGVWGDRGSAPYLVQSLNPQSPLYQRALARVKGQEATGDVVSNVAPFGGSVSTAGQEQAGAARMALPISPAELSRYRQESPELYALAQRRNDQAQLENPALRVADQYVATTPSETKLTLLRLWDLQNAGLLANRAIFNARRAQFMAGIGLAPSARTAFDVRELAPNPLTAPTGQPGGGTVPAPAPPRGQPIIPTGPLVPAR